jgi:Mannitol repressor
LRDLSVSTAHVVAGYNCENVSMSRISDLTSFPPRRIRLFSCRTREKIAGMNDQESARQEAVMALFSDVAKYFRVIRNESDRGCALVAASHLEYLLGELIKAHMINGPSKDSFFKGPLRSFSNRIKLAYFLGLISREIHDELNVILDIRNNFAHELKFEDFNDPIVKDRCVKLQHDVLQDSHDPRERFLNAASTLIVIIDFFRAGASPGMLIGGRKIELAVIQDIRNAADSIPLTRPDP